MKHAGLAVTLAITGCVFSPAGHEWSASACTIYANHYWYAETYSNYSGGVDGVGGTFWDDTAPPYVCDDATSHSVESVALFLPRSGDLIENGVDRGLAGATYGQCTCPNAYYFFQFTSVGSTSYLQVESQGEGAHAFYAQEVVLGCPSACQLYAQYTTDTTTWPLQHLPAGDNPGQQVVINGEVEQDKTDDMGPANEPADWRSPLVHAGTWVPWNNKNVTAGNLPYCNYDLSIGTSYEFQNLGPIASGGSC